MNGQKTDLPRAFIDKLMAVTAKRPATIIRHILAHGSVTSEEIKDLYGYNHPPRAIRDVRELGIPVETFRVKDKEGRNIAAYRFGNPNNPGNAVSKSRGRTALTKALKYALVAKFGSKCFIYRQHIDASLLQVDHRIPYEIAGESPKVPEAYMLLSPSANRAKSWACEHCPNWIAKDIELCVNCFWAHPEHYTHVSRRQERHIMLTFTGNEVKDYEKLIAQVGVDSAEATIKALIHNSID